MVHTRIKTRRPAGQGPAGRLGFSGWAAVRVGGDRSQLRERIKRTRSMGERIRSRDTRPLQRVGADEQLGPAPERPAVVLEALEPPDVPGGGPQPGQKSPSVMHGALAAELAQGLIPWQALQPSRLERGE